MSLRDRIFVRIVRGFIWWQASIRDYPAALDNVTARCLAGLMLQPSLNLLPLAAPAQHLFFTISAHTGPTHSYLRRPSLLSFPPAGTNTKRALLVFVIPADLDISFQSIPTLVSPNFLDTAPCNLTLFSQLHSFCLCVRCFNLRHWTGRQNKRGWATLNPNINILSPCLPLLRCNHEV